MVVIASPPEKQ